MVGEGEAPVPRAVVLVEGISDQAALEALAARRRRDLDAEGVSIVPIGGAQAIGNALTTYGPRGLDLELAGLCDAGEERHFRHALERAGLGSSLTRESMERLGFAHDNLARINPRIISASVKGFGTTGPYASYNSFEMIAQAMGGVMALTGEKDGLPLRVESGLGDTASGLHAAIGILAAIVQRQVTGVGQHIEIAQQDVVINLTRIHFRDYYLGVDPIPRKGNRSPAACPSNTYRCKPFGPNEIESLRALDGVKGITLNRQMQLTARHGSRDAMLEAVGGDTNTLKARKFKVEVEPGSKLVKGPYVAETFPVAVEEDYLVIDL